MATADRMMFENPDAVPHTHPKEMLQAVFCRKPAVHKIKTDILAPLTTALKKYKADMC